MCKANCRVLAATECALMESLEPSLPLLRQLKSEGKVICQIQVARAKPKTVKKTTVKKAAAVKRAPAKKTAKKKVVRKISRVQPAAKGTSKKRITKMSTGVFR